MATDFTFDDFMREQEAAPAVKISFDDFMREADKPVEGGFVAAAKQAVGATIKGAGQLAADVIPGVDGDNAVTRYGQEVVDANPTAVRSLGDIADKPGTAVKEATGNAAASMAGMVGARAAGMGITAAAPLTGPLAPVTAAVGQVVAWLGPVAIAALPSYGSIREKQVLNDPANNDSWRAKAIAGLGAGTVGAIETKFGPQNWALSALTKEGRAALAAKFAETTLARTIGFGALKGAAIEGAEELVQNPVEQLASFDNPLAPESLAETGFSGVMGAIGGGVMGGTAGAALRVRSPEEPRKTPEDILAAPSVDAAITTADATLNQSTEAALAATRVQKQRENLAAAEATQAERQAQEVDLQALIESETRNLQVLQAQLLEDADKQAQLDQIQDQGRADLGRLPEQQVAVAAAATDETPTAMQLAMQRALAKRGAQNVSLPTTVSPVDPATAGRGGADTAPGLAPELGAGSAAKRTVEPGSAADQPAGDVVSRPAGSLPNAVTQPRTPQNVPVQAQPAAPGQATPQTDEATTAARTAQTGFATTGALPGKPDLEAAGITAELLSGGTAAIRGDIEKIKAILQANGIKGVAGKTNVLVGKSQAQAAMALFQPTQMRAEPEADEGPLGRDFTPISQGGKAFKTNRDARAARKMQPHLRVVKAKDGKGFVLVPKTAKQLAAEAQAAKRIAGPRTGNAGKPMSAHEFVMTKGGMDPATSEELGIEGNPRVGSGWLYAGKGKQGLSLAQAAELLAEAGYIEDESERAAAEIIQRSFKSPQYTAEGWERIAQAEADTRFNDFLRAEQDEPSDDALAGLTQADLDEDGYADASADIQAEVRALLAMLEARGVDAESVLETVAKNTENATQQDYYEAAQRALQDALNAIDAEPGVDADSRAPAGQEGPAPGREAEAEPAVAAAPQTPADAGVSVSGAALTEIERRAAAVFQQKLDNADEKMPALMREQLIEQIQNPGRYHPVVEEENPKGLRIGDRVTVAEGSVEIGGRAVNQGVRQTLTGTVVSVQKAPPAYKSGYHAKVVTDKGYGGWYDLDRIEKTGEALTAPTREDVLAQQDRAEAGEKAAARARQQEEQRAQADAERGNFTLTGSDRAADVGMSRGQGDMFSDDTDRVRRENAERDQRAWRKRREKVEAIQAQQVADEAWLSDTEFGDRIRAVRDSLLEAGERGKELAAIVMGATKKEHEQGRLTEQGVSFREEWARKQLATIAQGDKRPSVEWKNLSPDEFADMDVAIGQMPIELVRAAADRYNELGVKLAKLGFKTPDEVYGDASEEARLLKRDMNDVRQVLMSLAPARFRVAKGYKNANTDNLERLEDEATDLLGINTRDYPGIKLDKQLTAGGERQSQVPTKKPQETPPVEDAAPADKPASQMTLADMSPADLLRAAADKMEGKATTKPAQTIEDFGEKIGGARKDVWLSARDQLDAVPDADIAAQPLSKAWPQPDYQALLDAGADPWTVGFMRAARDEIPAKPRMPNKVKRWAEQVRLLRDVTKQLLDGDIDPTKARVRLVEMARTTRGMADVASRVELYMAVGHRQSLAGVRLSAGEYSLYKGVEYKPAKVIWTVEKDVAATAFSNWPRELASGDTREQAIANFKAKYDSLEIQPAASKEVSFDIFADRSKDGYFVGKKIGRNIATLAGPFATIKEAREYRTNNQTELLAKLEKVREIPRERRDTNDPRVGEDMRNGQDATPQMFADAFGFRGVEFGNWVEQGKRQKDLNDAYDALMDMAAILGVPPRALSLNGQLGLAFGARGTGGRGAAAAHYERDFVAINLTKKEGAGSLGHEWFHALDNYFSRMRSQAGDMMTEGLDVSLASRGSNFIANTAVRREMVQAFGDVMRAIKSTAIKARSSRLDAKRSKEYWTTSPEMAARAFESYLISKLQDQNASNDYLANIVDEGTWKAAAALGFELDDSYPYPTAGEIPVIRDAFDKFFQTIEAVPGEGGNIALREPDAPAYTGSYETDLFGNPVPKAAGRSSAGARARGATSGDVRPAATVPGDTPAPAGDYLVRTIVGTEVSRQLGTNRILTPADAAQATAYLYKSAVERFDAIVTDKAGKPLAVVGGFKGTTNQTSVYPSTIMGEAIRVPGAAKIWFSHNHPSGRASLSKADMTLSNKMGDTFRGSGIEPMGIMAVAGKTFEHQPDGAIEGDYETRTAGPIPEPIKGVSVPVIERQLVDDNPEAREVIDNPIQAKDVARRFYAAAGGPGLILTDTQRKVVAWVPLPEITHRWLRNTGGLATLYRAVSESNASAAIVVHGGELNQSATGINDITASQNIAAALSQVDVYPMDSINVATGRSAAEVGLDIAAGPVYSRSAVWRSALTEGVQSINAKAQGAEGWRVQIQGLINKGRVKADEVEWSGLTDWLKLQTGKVTKEQVLEYLDGNGVQVEEVVLGKDNLPPMPDGWEVVRDEDGDGYLVIDDEGETRGEGATELDARRDAGDPDALADEVGQPKYGQHTLPGGENYREVLLTLPRMTGKQAVGRRAVFDKYLPEIERLQAEQDALIRAGARDTQRIRELGNELERVWDRRDREAAAAAGEMPEYKSDHWDVTNVVAHIRLKDRTDADGKRVLFVEEIQSDWGQEGKKKGFGDQPTGEMMRGPMVPGAPTEVMPVVRQGVPAAPFVTKTEGWLNLALKRVMMIAVEGGYDRVAFVNGQQSADRYDLSKQVDSIEWDDAAAMKGGVRISINMSSGMQTLYVDRGDGKVFRGNGPLGDIAGRALEDVIGKEIAKKIIESTSGELSGQGLKTGGEGMIAFYDNIVPQAVNKLLKKLGGDAVRPIQFLMSPTVPKEHKEFGYEDRLPKVRMEQSGFDITPAMREQAGRGLPMFSIRTDFTPAAKSQATDAVKALAREIASNWANAPKTVVAFDMDDERIPENVRREDQRQRSGGAAGIPEGFFYRGTVYLMASQLKTQEDVARVMFHEALGHYGLRATFGDALNPILKQVAALHRKEVDAKIREYGLRGVSELDRMTAAEEVLAELAEARPSLGLVKRAIAAIRTWLRENVPGFKNLQLTDDELIRDYILPARGWVERGAQAEVDAMVPAMSRSDIRYSRKVITGQTSRKYTADQLRAMGNVGFQKDVPSVTERAKALWQDAGKKLAQGIVDQFAPVKDIDKEAYGLLRLSKGASGAFEVLLHGGRLKLTDGVYDYDDQRKGGVIDRLLLPLQGEHHDFFRWVAANRAERLASEGRENLFTAQDIADLKTLADGTTAFDYTIQTGPNTGKVTRDRTLIYADAQRIFNEFNRNTLDLAEQSGLIDGASRHLWEHEFYVPFYRVADDQDGGIRGANIKSGVVRQEAFKKLKGGTGELNTDLLDNTLLNWAHLLDAAAKNRAAKATIEAAEKMGAATRVPAATKQSVWYVDKGQKQHAEISDPYLLTALTSLEYAGMRNPVMNAMGAFKHVLTVGVTASPFFKVRNLIRDSVQVIGTSNINPNPLTNVGEGWKLTSPKSDAYFRLLAGGGTIHFGTMLEGSEAKRVQALVESGVDDATILNSDKKLKAFYRRFVEPSITAYNELGNRGEAVNRASLYDQLRKQGMSHAEASLQARDLMDFSMQGSFTTIRFLSQVVPFFNARLQGMYKLGRGAKDDPKRFAAVLGATALLSLSLLWAYGDDDDWKKREDWDRNNYWWFKFGGMAFRIPKPFEIGAVATLAERGWELAFDKEMTGKRFRQQVMTLLGDNLSMNPVPQLVKPIVDIYANKDSFTGRPIESMSMERLKSEYRFTDRTSMTARATSTAANTITNLVGIESLSPVQIDHMLRGYFGWLGAFVVGAADSLARPLSGQPERAAPDLWKTATGGMVADLRDAPSRYVSQMYDQAKEIETAYGTWRALQKSGKTEEATEFRNEHRDELGRYRSVTQIKRKQTALNEQIRIIERSRMDPQVKREKIRDIEARKDRLARQIR